jgi:hypothetical protein
MTAMLHSSRDEFRSPFAGFFDDQNGSFEVFYAVAGELYKLTGIWNAEGWYNWDRLPNCMPDSEAYGPFTTSQEAYENAMDIEDELQVA